MHAGTHEHPDDSGGMVGINLDGGLRLGVIRVGGSIGFDDYALMDGAPIHAGTIAGRAGVAVPIAQTQTSAGRSVRFSALGSLEGGVHHYSADGEQKDFLGPTTTYQSETRSRTFGGIRTGVELALGRPGAKSNASALFRIEVVGRRDTHSADVDYYSVSCGGLFSNGCSDVEHGMTTVGGTELGVMSSIGVEFGGS